MNTGNLLRNFNFFDRNRNKVKEESKRYTCWLCSGVFEDPMAYLLHIRLCNMKHGNYNFSISEHGEKQDSEKAGFKT